MTLAVTENYCRKHLQENKCTIKYSTQMSRLVTRPRKWAFRPAKTQISLGIRPVWSEFSMCAPWVAKDPSFLHADSEDWSDWADAQADLSHRLAHSHFVGFIMRRLKYSTQILCLRGPVDYLIQEINCSPASTQVSYFVPHTGEIRQ